ncbi:hypothetical protein FACS1894217_02930 [Clostridia bacterium]|nr:hypothetical protein FACS1894217_02930 [Clostridia bacterium]
MKRKLTKIVALLSVVLMLSFTLAACSTDDAKTSPTNSPTGATTDKSTDKPSDNPTAAAGITGIDFKDGKFDFVKMDLSQKTTSPDFKLELAEFDGAPALKVAPVGSKKPFIAISVDGLVEDVAAIASVDVQLAVKSKDGEFWAASGEIIAYSGADLTETKGKWAINTEETNPKIATLNVKTAFASGKGNYVAINPTLDDGTAYKGHNEYYILGIGLKGADGKYLTTNSGAAASFVDGFGLSKEIPTVKLDLLALLPDGKYVPGAWNTVTVKTTDAEPLFPLEALPEAVALVVEFNGTAADAEAIQAGNLVFQAQLSPDWTWTEYKNGATDLIEYEDGKIIFYFPEAISAAVEGGALSFANWDSLIDVTAFYMTTAYGAEATPTSAG